MRITISFEDEVKKVTWCHKCKSHKEDMPSSRLEEVLEGKEMFLQRVPMSRIRTIIEKIDSMIDRLPNKMSLIELDLKELKELLTDKTVLFLEWGEEDVQAVARQRIAHLEDVEECEVKENPLNREQVERVLEVLEGQYDCNYGITWEHLAMAMDYIDLPNIIEAGRRPMTRKQFEEYLTEKGIPLDDLKSEGGRIPDTAKYGRWLRKNDLVAFNVMFEEERRNRR